MEIDDGYEVGYGDHSFDVAKFPSVESVIEKIHAMGSNVTLWVTPFINPESFEFEKVLDLGCFVRGICGGEETVMTRCYILTF